MQAWFHAVRCKGEREPVRRRSKLVLVIAAEGVISVSHVGDQGEEANVGYRSPASSYEDP